MLKTGPHDQLILGLRAEGRIVRLISYQKANGNRWQPLSTLPPRRFSENLPSCRSRVPEPRTLEPAGALAWGRIHAHQPGPIDRSFRAKEQPFESAQDRA